MAADEFSRREEIDAPSDDKVDEWVALGEVGRLEQLVLDGRGHLLRDKHTLNAASAEFLRGLTQYQTKIDAIHTAVEEGDVRRVKSLIDRPQFSTARDAYGMEKVRFTCEESDFIVEKVYDAREVLESGNELRNAGANKARNREWKGIQDAFLLRFKIVKDVESIKENYKYRKLSLKKNKAKWTKYLNATGGGVDRQIEKELSTELGRGDFLLSHMLARSPTFQGVGIPSLESGRIKREFSGSPEADVVEETPSSRKDISAGPRSQKNNNSWMMSGCSQERRENYATLPHPTCKRSSGQCKPMKKAKKNRFSLERNCSDSGDTSSVEDGDYDLEGQSDEEVRVFSEQRTKRRARRTVVSQETLRFEHLEMIREKTKAYRLQSEVNQKMLLFMDKAMERMETLAHAAPVSGQFVNYPPQQESPPPMTNPIFHTLASTHSTISTQY